MYLLIRWISGRPMTMRARRSSPGRFSLPIFSTPKPLNLCIFVLVANCELFDLMPRYNHSFNQFIDLSQPYSVTYGYCLGMSVEEAVGIHVKFIFQFLCSRLELILSQLDEYR